MRTVASALLVCCLLFGVPHPATAADKIRIEIVEATTTIGLMPYTDPGSPERISTNCDTRLHKNTASTDCNSTVTPAIARSSSWLPSILSFEVKVILPNGSHMKLMCSPSPSNKKCGGIKPVAGSAPDRGKCEFDASVAFIATGAAVNACAANADDCAVAVKALSANAPAADATKTCTAQNLGFYKARWEYDKSVGTIDLVIYAKRKVNYQIKGSW
jgi:hypothetical protein